ncbi:hypothetical protein HDU84_003547 [Entophlyctis sp. JEL0112]|nr:hypothetical protein HDU84_003547 [Entophlyctis sp. JEL0112]
MKGENSIAIHPWIHSFSNQQSREHQLRTVRIPDIVPGGIPPTADFSMVAGDFLDIYSSPKESEIYDAVVTCYFIDTAKNIFQYLEVLWNCLAPGGGMKNEMSVELNLEELRAVAKTMGFIFEHETMMKSTYTSNETSMLQYKEFDEEEKRFKTCVPCPYLMVTPTDDENQTLSFVSRFEAKVEKLHREAKGYLDAVRAMTVAQQRMAETVDHFYDEGGALGYAGLQYKQAVEKLDEECRNELDSNCRITVLEPLGKLIQTFPDFNEAIKKRQKKLLDYDQLLSKSRKLAEKPSNDPQAYPIVCVISSCANGADESKNVFQAQAATNQAKEIYDSINTQLVTEIPRLIDLRVPYLDPSFEALVKSQLVFNEGAYHKLKEIERAFEKSGVGSGADGDMFEGKIEGVLQQMRELSICGSL